MTRRDYLILGAGPGGLQLAYELARAGRSYLVLDQATFPGSFFASFPRHRRLISANKIHTGSADPEVRLRFDWNSLLGDFDGDRFQHYSTRYFPGADDMVRYLADFASRHNLAIRLRTRIEKIAKEGNDFLLTDEEGNDYQAPRLIIATGNAKPYVPPLPGIGLAEHYAQVPLNPSEFEDQRVLIIGKGNSGLETANHLLETTALIHLVSPSPLRFAWKSHFVGDVRAVNTTFLDTYGLKLQNALIDASIDRIERRADGKLVASVSYSHAQGEREELVYDRVIACTGFRFDHGAFDGTCRPHLVHGDRFPEQTSAWESANVPGLFFAGALTQERDYKRASSGFIHGFRYNARALERIFGYRFHDRPLPYRMLELSPEALVAAVISRINTSSALWQQYGFLADTIELLPRDHRARYYEELPVQFILESEIARDECFLVTLEFGKIHGDPFGVARYRDPAAASQSTLLHPVVRRYVQRQCVEELHLLENLFAEWRHPELHVEVLRRSFESWIRRSP